MSMSITATTASGPFALLVADARTSRQTLDRLTEQAADGKISDSYAGLGATARQSLELEPALAANQTWQANIDAASGPMQTAQTALQQISSIAGSFYAQTQSLGGLNSSDIDTIAASARDALGQVANLLDTTYGNSYVFAGQDGANPPVPSPDAITTSGFYTQINAAVTGLAGNGAASVISTTLGIAQSNNAGTSPFSAALSQPPSVISSLRPSVAVGDGQTVPTGLLASSNADVASTGSSTTGSYTRDILRSLATLGSLSSSQVNDPGFSAIVNDVRGSLSGAITALNQDAGVMGNRQSSLTALKTTLADTATTLKSQIGSAEHVDMTTTLSNLSAAQTQLQASYQLIAGFQSLSLVKFLGSG